MPTTDTITGLCRTQRSLTGAGISADLKDTRVTARVRKCLVDAARSRCGIAKETDPITAGLTLLAAQDDLGAWFATRRGALSDDFDIGL